MKKVKDVMRTTVITASPNITINEAAKIMTKNKVGSLVLIENQKPVGIVTSEDVVSAVANNVVTNIKAKDIPRKEFFTVTPEDDVMQLTKLMMKTGVKRIPVIRNDQLVGIISEKEIVLMAPEMIDILSEKLKARVEQVATPDTITSGICEGCEGYSDELLQRNSSWFCEDCRA